MLNRACGALIGGAIGDAMGMPASFMTRAQIEKAYGYINGFLNPKKEVQSYHGGLKSAEITDDTMESVIISDVIIQNGHFSEEAFNAAMKKWAIEQKMLESTVIGPSTRRYLTELIEGRDPKLTSGQGVTNGSSMRAAPIGIKYHDDIGACIEAAAASSMPSHGSAPAVAGACAVAAGVALGVSGRSTPRDIIRAAAEAAAFGEKKGAIVTAPLLSKRLSLCEKIVDEMKGQPINAILDELVGIFGASMMAYESVAISYGAFYAVGGVGPDGVLAAVNAGDDADTNGSICGNICGAYSGASSFPNEWKERVMETSGIDFMNTAKLLLG